MTTGGANLKQQLMRELNELPPDKLMEVLDFDKSLGTLFNC